MRVVLADPSRTVQKAVARLLQSRGHDVCAFTDGREALVHLRDNKNIDALITSTEPMGISGFELCWETRLLAGGQRPIYIIMMSASREQHILCEALDSGADDFISKPPASEELYARMRAAERLVQMERELIELASLDPLTGALNRRAFFDSAQNAATRARDGIALAVVMMDIDHFKRVNDVHGHDAGDRALQAIARVAAGEPAVLGRLGGEEFVFLMPSASAGEAMALGERVRERIAALEVATENGVLTMTASFGVSEWEAGDNIDSLLKRADTALYQAKTGGRNRVVVATDIAAWTSVPENPDSIVRASQRVAVMLPRPIDLAFDHS